MKAVLRPAGLAALLGMLLWAAPAAAAMYKWVDGQGNVHYTQNPPVDRDAQTITPPPPAPSSQGSKPANTPDEGDEQAAEPPAEDNPAEDKEWAAVRRKNCEAARRNLEIYKNARRIRTPAGEVISLTDEMRKEKIQESEKQIKDFCK